MLQPQPSKMHHTLPNLCYALEGCVCNASRVCYVIARAFQKATYTTQLVLCFERLCVHCKQGMLCYNHSLPECNAYFQLFVFYSAHPQRHTQCSSELLSFFCSCLVIFGALLRIMCMILFHCPIRAAAFCYLSRTMDVRDTAAIRAVSLVVSQANDAAILENVRLRGACARALAAIDQGDRVSALRHLAVALDQEPVMPLTRARGPFTCALCGVRKRAIWQMPASGCAAGCSARIVPKLLSHAAAAAVTCVVKTTSKQMRAMLLCVVQLLCVTVCYCALRVLCVRLRKKQKFAQLVECKRHESFPSRRCSCCGVCGCCCSCLAKENRKMHAIEI